MSNRTLFALTLTFALAPAAWGADEPAAGVLQLAQASTAADAVPMRSDVKASPYVPGTQRGVREAAEKGPDALRRYVFRTRNIYAYSFEDYAKPEWYR